MKIIKRPAGSIKIEEAHGGSGSRKVYADKSHLKSAAFEAMTYGYLPSGELFDWHSHDGIEEIMVVMSGNGKVEDEDGQYDYADGDVFIFPSNTRHRILNKSDVTHEFVFVRVKI